MVVPIAKADSTVIAMDHIFGEFHLAFSAVSVIDLITTFRIFSHAFLCSSLNRFILWSFGEKRTLSCDALLLFFYIFLDVV